jgi:hypothetical protein
MIQPDWLNWLNPVVQPGANTFSVDDGLTIL